MVKIKISYERPEEVRKVLLALQPYVKHMKSNNASEGQFKRIYIVVYKLLVRHKLIPPHIVVSSCFKKVAKVAKNLRFSEGAMVAKSCKKIQVFTIEGCMVRGFFRDSHF